MTDEEYRRLKEAEKEHLRAKQKLQKTLQVLQRKQGVRDVVNRMARSAQGALDRASDLISKLTAETARDEAHLDVAMDAVGDADASTDDPDVEAFEAKRRAEHARMLVRQMKQSQALSGPSSSRMTSSASPSETSGSEKRSSPATSSGEDLSTSDPDDLPEKTIGRMR